MTAPNQALIQAGIIFKAIEYWSPRSDIHLKHLLEFMDIDLLYTRWSTFHDMT